jgi:hypothetical protein
MATSYPEPRREPSPTGRELQPDPETVQEGNQQLRACNSTFSTSVQGDMNSPQPGDYGEVAGNIFFPHLLQHFA